MDVVLNFIWVIFFWCILLPIAFGIFVWGFYSIPGVRPFMDKNEDKLQKFGSILAIAGIVWFFAVFIRLGAGPAGDAEINVFPDGGNAKNYRLTADVNTKVSLDNLIFTKDSYEINSAVWPDGGRLDFKDKCTIPGLGQRVKCLTKDEKAYYIEIATPPQPADPDGGY